MNRIYVIVLVCFTHLGINFAQDDAPTYYIEIKPKHSYTIDFGLPISIANRPFKGIMQGLVRFSGSYQFALKNNLSFGLGLNYSYFMINRFKVTPQIMGGVHIPTVYFKLAYEKYYSERIGIDAGIKVGYAQNYFHSQLLEKPNLVEATLVEPYFSFCLTADHKSAFKWNVSYSFLALGFTPQRIGDFDNEDYKTSEYNRITRFLSFGFSYTHYFKQY